MVFLWTLLNADFNEDSVVRVKTDLNLNIIQPCVLHKLFISPLPGGCFYPTVGSLPGLMGSHSVHTQLSIQPKSQWVHLCTILGLLSKTPLLPVPYPANSSNLCSMGLWSIYTSESTILYLLSYSREVPSERKPEDHGAHHGVSGICPSPPTA